MVNASNSTDEQRDHRHHVHPWQGMSETVDDAREVISAGEGVYLRDEYGNRLMDGPGGMWCVQVGHGRREIADAIARQAMTAAYCSPWSHTSTPAVELAETLARLTPADLNRVCFTTGGSTAVDTALRFVQFYNNVLGRPEKKCIISREQAYHGSAYLSAGVSGKERDRSFMDAARDQVSILPSVKSLDRDPGESLSAFCDRQVAALEQEILRLGPERVAAFIAEPVQASGGVIVPPEGYLKRCAEVCRAHGVLFIADEVVTGFGRLGHWFASEAVFGATPDIITTAKGLTSGYQPLGACCISDRLFEDLAGESAAFANGYTYSAHPVSCAAALENIAIMEREDLLSRVRETSAHMQARLASLRELPLVRDVRGVGLLGCVECGDGADLARDHQLGAEIDEACQRRGLLVRPIVNLCVVSPPLIISTEQIDTMVDILGESIEAVAARYG
ncbi:MAG: aminotransferase [Pseudomonadota bacterium]